MIVTIKINTSIFPTTITDFRRLLKVRQELPINLANSHVWDTFFSFLPPPPHRWLACPNFQIWCIIEEGLCKFWWFMSWPINTLGMRFMVCMTDSQENGNWILNFVELSRKMRFRKTKCCFVKRRPCSFILLWLIFFWRVFFVKGNNPWGRN